MAVLCRVAIYISVRSVSDSQQDSKIPKPGMPKSPLSGTSSGHYPACSVSVRYEKKNYDGKTPNTVKNWRAYNEKNKYKYGLRVQLADMSFNGISLNVRTKQNNFC